MEAPTPVSAYLHGASMVKVGVCVFARALVSAGEVPEIVGWVAIIDAMVTMLFGFLMYLPQKDMKRLLAFSTIAQLSYVFFGLGLSVFGSQLAFDGAVCHIFNHAFAKTLFFLIAGSFSFTQASLEAVKLPGELSRRERQRSRPMVSKARSPMFTARPSHQMMEGRRTQPWLSVHTRPCI